MVKVASSRSQNDFAEYIDFDFENGEAYWKKDLGNGPKAGDPVGYVCNEGYVRFGLHGIKYQLHVVMFFVYHGYWPNEVDHVDRDKLNNKIVNLVDGTHQDNMQNLGLRVDNQYGCRGVSKCSKSSSNPWIVRVLLRGKQIIHQRFSTFEEAESVAIATYSQLGLSHE